MSENIKESQNLTENESLLLNDLESKFSSIPDYDFLREDFQKLSAAKKQEFLDTYDKYVEDDTQDGGKERKRRIIIKKIYLKRLSQDITHPSPP